MTSINSISTTTDTTVKTSQISDSTKRQLEALGIDASTVTSEAQAKSLIANKQAEKSFEQSLYTNQTEETEDETSSSSETSLISEAKSLAEELGVSVSSNDTFDDITAAISKAIDELIDKSANDPQALQRAQSYRVQLSQLSSQYSDVSTSNSNLYNIINAQAATTKYLLNL